MKIASVSVPDTASDPLHPDHDRWVKDRTLRMEIDHARRIGATVQDAERENARLLARMEALARFEKVVTTRPVPAKRERSKRHAERGVFVRPPQKVVAGSALSPCGRCGTCRRCMREKRVYAIIKKAKLGDRVMKALADGIAKTVMAANTSNGRFAGKSAKDSQRMLIATVEKLCDQSIRSLGEWR